jgi:signal transduction histidine kinase
MSSQVGANRETSSVSGREVPARSAERILVVDDEENIRSTLTEFFAMLGYETETAEDGTRALDVLGRRSYDLLLVDLRMPGLDGISVIEWIRETQPNLPVIVMTGHATVETTIRALRLGAYDYILKPFTLDEMERTVGNCLEKRRLEMRNTELSEMNERLREIEALKDNLLATVSHEFRTPLTAIRGFLALIDGPGAAEPSEHRAHALDAIRENVNRLDTMIANLLLMMESQDGAYAPILEPMPLGAFLDEFVHLRRHARLRTDFQLDVDATARAREVLIDRNRFPLVLTNLLDNAYKFTRDPVQAEVIVRARCDTSETHLEVHDSGIGIADTLGDEVFERFTQADMTSTREYQGVGMGLAVVRSIVQAHNGVVRLVPPVLGGTSIRVVLPVPAREPGR